MRKTHQAEMWSSTPLDGRTLYVVFWRKHWPSGSCRKYYTGRRGFTENRYLVWKTDDRAAAERVASTIPGGLVAEWKNQPVTATGRAHAVTGAAEPRRRRSPVGISSRGAGLASALKIVERVLDTKPPQP